MRRTLFALSTLALAFLSLSCTVQEKNSNLGEDVKISTPFGGMNVKTMDNAQVSGIGLAAYPGAQLVKNDNDSGSADVDMNFGKFKLRVKAASYRTSDDSEKVIKFYRKEMSRYGEVIACRGKQPVGTPTVTHEGLSCSDDKHQEGDSDQEFQLKTGSPNHQRIVAITPEGSGTKFGLVMLDLPMEGKQSN